MPTRDEFARARAALGLSAYELGDLLALGGDNKAQGDFVREIESGARECSGPIWQVVQALLAGWRPGAPSLDMQDLRRITETLTGLQRESELALDRARSDPDPDERWHQAGIANGLSRATTLLTGVIARMIPA